MSETEYVPTSITLDTETMARLKKMASETDRSVSAMVRWCINAEYDRVHQVAVVTTQQP